MYVCKYVCMHIICMYVMIVHTYVCLHVCMYVMNVHTYVCMFVFKYVCIYVCMYVCMYACMFVCMMYVCLSMYVICIMHAAYCV